MPIRFPVALILLFWLLPVSADTAEQERQTLKQLAAHYSPTETERKSGAAVVKQTIEIISLGQGKTRTRIHNVIALLDQQSVSDYRTVKSTFNAYYSTGSLDFAYVLTPVGKIVQPASDAVQTVSVGSELMYNNKKTLQFSPPGLAPGAFIDYSFSFITHKAEVGEHWWVTESPYHYQTLDRQPGYRIDPLREAEIIIETVAGETIHLSQNFSRKPEVSASASGGKRYRWSFKNLPGVTPESFMTDVFAERPWITATTFDSWAQINDWARERYIKPPSPSVTALAKKLTQDARTKQAKIERIYNWLQNNVHYINANFNASGLIAHSPAQVVANRYGDCKDQANLFATLLRSIGIEAWPALLNPAFTHQPQKDAPTLNFRHMITWVPESDAPWVDLAGDKAIFPGLDAGYMGQTAFIINDKQGRLITIPNASEKDGSIEVNVKFSPPAPGKTLSCTLNLRAHGSAGNRLKLAYDANGQDDLNKLANTFYSKATVISAKAAVDNRDWVMEAVLEFPTVEIANAPVPVGQDVSIMAGMFLRDLANPAPKKRVNPGKLPGPARLTLNVELDWDPKKWQSRTTVNPLDWKQRGFKITTISKDRPGHASRESTIEAQPLVLDARAFHDMQKSISRALTTSAWALTLTPVGHANASPAVAASGNTLSACRQLVDTGQYDKAVSKLEPYLAKHPDDGEAHYLYGLALGFLGEYDKSEQHLKKAETLGHVE